MRNATKALFAGALAILVGGAVAAASAADDPAAVIKKRQDLMKEMGGDMKAIYEFTEGKGGTAADVAGRAKDIAEDATEIAELFPKGTSMDDGVGKTGAKAVIWQEWDKFTAAATNLETEAKKMVEVAEGGDAGLIKAQFDMLGKNGCGGCHQTFRQKLD